MLGHGVAVQNSYKIILAYGIITFSALKNNSQLQTTQLWGVAMCSSLQMHICSFIISATQGTVSRNCPLRIWFSTKFSGSAIILCTQGNAVINVHFSYFNLWAPHVYWFCCKTKCQVSKVVIHKFVADLWFLNVNCGRCISTQ